MYLVSTVYIFKRNNLHEIQANITCNHNSRTLKVNICRAYSSHYSKSTAPEGHGCFRAEATHRGQHDHQDKQWLQSVAKGLENAGILRLDQVVLLEACNNEFAYIDQDLAFAERVARVRKWFDESGYLTFGRFGRYEYHNSDQCVQRAKQVHAHIQAMAKTGDPATLELP